MTDELETREEGKSGREEDRESAEETASQEAAEATAEQAEAKESPGEDGSSEAASSGDDDTERDSPSEQEVALGDRLGAPQADGPRVEAIPEDEEEVVFETSVGDEPEAIPMTGAGEGLVRALSELRQARQEIEESEEKAKGAEDRLLRLGAEFDNYRKRMVREREDDKKYANEKIVKEFLPIVDNLERALSAAEGSCDEQLVSGVQMVLKQFLDALRKFGVVQFSAMGEPFDPERHEAMQQVETEEVAPGTVVTEYMKGFSLNERLLRPSMVVVAKAPQTAPATGGEDGAAGTELPSKESGE